MTLDEILSALQAREGLLGTLSIELTVKEGVLHGAMTVAPLLRRAGHRHGGSVMALLDSALGLHALGLALEHGCSTSTVEPRPTSPAGPVGQRLVVRPEVQSRGRRLLVLSGAAVDEATGDRMAFAVGTFNVFPAGRLKLSPDE